jgi:transposase, IS5 family
MKITARCGTAAVDGCNEALLAKAAEVTLLRTSRLRADTTVVPADVAYPTVAYPTDSGLLAKAVRRIGAAGRRVQAAGGTTRTQGRDRSRSAGRGPGRSGRSCGCAPRKPAMRPQPWSSGSPTSWPGLAERAATEAEALLGNARRAVRRAQTKAAELTAAGERDPDAGRRRGRLRRAVNDLADLLAATRRIAAQTR